VWEKDYFTDEDIYERPVAIQMEDKELIVQNLSEDERKVYE